MAGEIVARLQIEVEFWGKIFAYSTCQSRNVFVNMRIPSSGRQRVSSTCANACVAQVSCLFSVNAYAVLGVVVGMNTALPVPHWPPSRQRPTHYIPPNRMRACREHDLTTANARPSRRAGHVQSNYLPFFVGGLKPISITYEYLSNRPNRNSNRTQISTRAHQSGDCRVRVPMWRMHRLCH
ncbi:unnamed protein product [Sphagnum balticum]